MLIYKLKLHPIVGISSSMRNLWVIPLRLNVLLLISLLTSPNIPLLAQRSIASSQQEAISRGRFYQDSRAELALLRARGEATVTLVIAAREGANERIARLIKDAGGIVRYRDDEVAYLRADVPLEQAESIANSDNIESADIDVSSRTTRTLIGDAGSSTSSFGAQGFTNSNFKLEASLASDNPLPQEPKWPNQPFVHPYSPLKDLGAVELRRVHPTYDGRGITIGHVEQAADLLLPEFETAYTLDGKPTPKIVDVRTTIDPDHVHDKGIYAGLIPWVRMNIEITTAGEAFKISERTYLPPRLGKFRFGLFNGQRLCDSLSPYDPEEPPSPSFDINAEPPAPAAACQFGVLWDDHTNQVWLDTNRDGSFGDERVLTDFALRHDVGVIGRDDQKTAARESYPFTVQTDAKGKAVAINVGLGGHATMVAGSAVASRGARGHIDGVAPGAQLLEIDYGSECVAGMIEGLINAFSDPRVDIVLLEQNGFITMPYKLSDGRFTSTIITSRLIAKYQKPFAAPAGNRPGLNAVGDEGNAKWGFSVGAYESKDSYLINHGFTVPYDNVLHIVGSWGPSGNGAIKPDIVVPAGYLSTLTHHHDDGMSGIKGLYVLPAGYVIGSGTSQAAATLAGALAMLMSAAKQERIPYDAEHIWRAVTDSARWISNLQAHQQGNGAVDVAGALELLKAYAKTSSSISLTSKASVRTLYSKWFTTPDEGVSIWESTGWRAGARGERIITLTRTTGPREPLTFSVSWLSTDPTFASASTVTLPLGKPIAFPISIGPLTAGAHSALLTLDHPSLPGHVYRLMTTVVCGDRFEKDRNYTIASEGKTERPGPVPFYFNVPLAAEAFAATFTGPGILWRWLAPGGLRNEPNSQLMMLPRPGIWELISRLNNDSLDLAWSVLPADSAPRVPYRLSVTCLGVQIDAPSTVAMKIGETYNLDISVRNTFGPFKGGLVATVLGAARSVRAELKPREQRVFDIYVPEGSPLLLAELDGIPSESDVDMYLFDCTGKRCKPVSAILDLGTQPRLRLSKPKAGMWKVVLDASRIPSGGATVNYTDVVADPSLGAVSVTDVIRLRATNEQWKATANVWLAKPPEPGRVPTVLFTVNALSPGVAVPVGIRTTSIVEPRPSRSSSVPRHISWSVGINRRGVVNERVIQERSSEPSWPRVMRGRS